MGKKPKPNKQVKSKPAKSEKEEQDKPKVNLLILPSEPTDEEIQEFLDKLLKDDSETK